LGGSLVVIDLRLDQVTQVSEGSIHDSVLVLESVGLLLEKTALIPKAGLVIQKQTVLLQEEVILLVGLLPKETALLLDKPISLSLEHVILLLQKGCLLLEDFTLFLEIRNVHAEGSSGIGDALLDSMLDHRAHVIVGADEVLLSRVDDLATLEHSVRSVVISLLSLHCLKVVVNTTSDFLISLTLERYLTDLDAECNLFAEVDV
jgi:hypothetical protein